MNREIAILVAKHFVVNLDRLTQTPFIVFSGLRNHQDDEILEAQDFIEGNYKTKITVESLAEQLHLTRRTFERRFKKKLHHITYLNTYRKYALKEVRKRSKLEENLSRR